MENKMVRKMGKEEVVEKVVGGGRKKRISGWPSRSHVCLLLLLLNKNDDLICAAV